MKKQILLALMLLCATFASARLIWNVRVGGGMSTLTTSSSVLNATARFAGKAGVNTEFHIYKNFLFMPTVELAMKGANYTINNSNTSNYYDMDVTDAVCLQAPLFLAYRIPVNLLNITLKVGPYFGYKVFDFEEDDIYIPYTETSKYIEYELKYINGQQQRGEIIDNREYSHNYSHSYKIEDIDYGVVFGVDFEYRRFVFGLEYQLGIANLFDINHYIPTDYSYNNTYNNTYKNTIEENHVSYSGPSVNEKLKNSAFYATFGYKF